MDQDYHAHARCQVVPSTVSIHSAECSTAFNRYLISPNNDDPFSIPRWFYGIGPAEPVRRWFAIAQAEAFFRVWPEEDPCQPPTFA